MQDKPTEMFNNKDLSDEEAHGTVPTASWCSDEVNTEQFRRISTAITNSSSGTDSSNLKIGPHNNTKKDTRESFKVQEKFTKKMIAVFFFHFLVGGIINAGISAGVSILLFGSLQDRLKLPEDQCLGLFQWPYTIMGDVAITCYIGLLLFYTFSTFSLALEMRLHKTDGYKSIWMRFIWDRIHGPESINTNKIKFKVYSFIHFLIFPQVLPVPFGLYPTNKHFAIANEMEKNKKTNAIELQNITPTTADMSQVHLERSTSNISDSSSTSRKGDIFITNSHDNGVKDRAKIQKCDTHHAKVDPAHFVFETIPFTQWLIRLLRNLSRAFLLSSPCVLLFLIASIAIFLPIQLTNKNECIDLYPGYLIFKIVMGMTIGLISAYFNVIIMSAFGWRILNARAGIMH